MKLNKIAKRLSRDIEDSGKVHGLSIKATPVSVIRNGEQFIYDIRLKSRTTLQKLCAREKDIQIALRLPQFHIYTEGLSIRAAVSFRTTHTATSRKTFADPAFWNSRLQLPIALGYDLQSNLHIADLANFPHTLYGGATNSGKTVGLQCLIMSIAIKQPVNKVNMVVINTVNSGLDRFNSLPHLLHPIVRDKATAVKIMTRLVAEMKRRAALSREELEEQPSIVCVVDEFNSLINSLNNNLGKESFTYAISEILRRGRHSKIHMVLASQESTKQDMTINLNNIDTRIAFRCSDFYSSRSILGESGAEKLPGKGSMLFKSAEYPKPVHLQGVYLPDDEINFLLKWIDEQPHDLSAMAVLSEVDDSLPTTQDGVSVDSPVIVENPVIINKDAELADICLWVLSRATISATQLKTQFSMGNRAGEIVKRLCIYGLISEKDANKPRRVLPQCLEDIPDEVNSLFAASGISQEMIVNAVAQRQ